MKSKSLQFLINSYKFLDPDGKGVVWYAGTEHEDKLGVPFFKSNVAAYITIDKDDFPVGEYAVGNTSVWVKAIDLLGEILKPEINRVTQDYCECKFLGKKSATLRFLHPGVVNKSEHLKAITFLNKKFNIKSSFDNEFITNFVKMAKSYSKDDIRFVNIVSDTDKLIVNFKNRSIDFSLDTDCKWDVDKSFNLQFDYEKIVAIFDAHKKATTVDIHLIDIGAKFEFSYKDFEGTASYMLAKEK